MADSKAEPAKSMSDLNSSLLMLSLYCDSHPDQKIAMFCRQHDCVICSECEASFHRNCQSIISIEKAAMGTRGSTAMADLEQRLDNLLMVTTRILLNCNMNSTRLDVQKEQVQERISEMRVILNSRLDKIEADLNEDLKNLHEKGTCCIEKDREVIKGVYDQASVWMKDLKTLKGHASDIHIFQIIKKVDIKVHQQETNVEKIRTEVKDLDILFEPTVDASIQNQALLFGNISLIERTFSQPITDNKIQQGQVYVPDSPARFKPRLVSSFKTSKLEIGAKIQKGCFVDKNKLLFASYENKCLYLCNENGAECEKILLDYPPSSVAAVDTSLAITTLGTNGIQLINLQTLRPGIVRKFSAFGVYDSIYSLNGETWVKDGRKISLVDNWGMVKKEISAPPIESDIGVDSQGHIYCFSSYEFFTIKSNGDYVTGYYQRDIINKPVGVAVDNKGDVYVAGNQSHSINKITDGGQNSHVVLTEEDGINRPTGLAHNPKTNEFMVINQDSNSIYIYKL